MYKQIESRYKWVDDVTGESVTISSDMKHLYVSKRGKPDNDGIMKSLEEKTFGSPFSKNMNEKALKYAIKRYNLGEVK